MIKDIKKEVEEIEKWIKNYIKESHADGVVVGNSGGKDSANFGNPSTREKNRRIGWKRFKA